MKYFALGVVAGFALAALLKPVESSCCQRVAYAARDKIAGLAGPLSGLVGGALDASGLTNAIPGLLDSLGVPKDM